MPKINRYVDISTVDREAKKDLIDRHSPFITAPESAKSGEMFKVTVKVGNHMGRVDPAGPVGGLVEQRAVRGEDKDVVVSGDQLAGAVTVEVGDDRRGKPAGLAREVADEDRRLHRAAARAGVADRRARGRYRQGGRDQDGGGQTASR